jgi:hypothetical protein
MPYYLKNKEIVRSKKSFNLQMKADTRRLNQGVIIVKASLNDPQSSLEPKTPKQTKKFQMPHIYAFCFCLVL